jgi:hypothetical protein
VDNGSKARCRRQQAESGSEAEVLPIAFAGKSKMGSGLSDHGASLVKIETKRPETRIPVN